jgi:ABC-type multidrug transport system fused ATPase/permease subunit
MTYRITRLIVTRLENNYLSNKGHVINADENKERVKAGWGIYYKFFMYTKWTIVSIVSSVLINVVKRITDILFDYYTLQWVKDISQSQNNNITLFTLVVSLSVVTTLGACFTGLIQIAFVFSVSIKLFKDMITRVCYAPVNMYFDVTPTGVILNRFSNDIQTVEMVLPFTIRSQMINYISIISGLAIATYNVPWVLGCIPFMIAACYFLLKSYSKSLKETSRIQSISSSPILTHLSETLNGISTIRTFNKVGEFEQRQYFLQNQNVACMLLRRGVKGWFNTRVSLILIVFMFFTFIYCIFAKGTMDPVLIGLMMVYLMDIQFNLVSLFR